MEKVEDRALFLFLDAVIVEEIVENIAHVEELIIRAVGLHVVAEAVKAHPSLFARHWRLLDFDLVLFLLGRAPGRDLGWNGDACW